MQRNSAKHYLALIDRMFTIRFKTRLYRPDLRITIRTNIDQWEARDLEGMYRDDEWRFELDEAIYAPAMAFKFVLERTYWMLGPNLILQPANGGNYVYEAPQVLFPSISEVIVENSYFQHRFFKPNLDETHFYDVIVIGSGIGGGIVADQLADLGHDVLVLEAGSVLFPTHIGNLPRQHQVGKFDKHLWGLYDEYKVINFVSQGEAKFDGGQAFNLGGRSVFWGGFIPRMSWWELESWPQSVRWYLEDSGYQRAEDMMYWPPPPSGYQQDVKSLLKTELPDYDHFDAPMAVRHFNPAVGTISTGLFSTADLLSESILTNDDSGNKKLTINLNHAVTKLENAGNQISRVIAHDLLVDKVRKFQGKVVVLAAGAIESAKIIKMSNLSDPHGLVGKGITDHPIFFTHFEIPKGAPYHRAEVSSKTLSRHKQASAAAHPYNILMELGADLNQGRYLDSDILRRHRQLKGDTMLCEIVFLFNSPLVLENRLDHQGSSAAKPVILMKESSAANAFLPEIDHIKNAMINALGGQALTNSNLNLVRAPLGGVAHEVGTLRMGNGNGGIVDENLQYNGLSNLFVCDLSMFPTSPAANPTLTLAALAIRLAEHISTG